jgi:O-antigen ligase
MTRGAALAPRLGDLNASMGAAVRPAVTPVLVRIHPRTSIINIWLVLIVLVGAIIVLADGLTRIPIEERQFTWNGPFDYEACLGALLLAGATFPLMILYARKTKASVTEGLFLWFVFCTTAYARDFSYLRLPGTPIFVTDVVLLVLLVSIYVVRRPRPLRTPIVLNILLCLFLVAGAVSAAKGLSGHRDAILVLRDLALVVYVLFLFVTQNLLRTWLSIKRALLWIVLGSVLGTLSGLGWFVMVPSEGRFIWCGIYILVSLLGILLAIANRLVRRRVGWLLVIILCLGLSLANTRSLFVSLVVLLPIGLLMGPILGDKVRSTRLAATVVTAAALAAFVTFLFLRTQVGRDFVTLSADRLASGVLHSDTDVDWQFRILAWKEAWRRFEKNPLLGEGFGVPFVFELADIDVRPHNTFLTVLYKMGLVGFSLLFALLGCFFWHGLRAVRRNLAHQRVAFLQITLLAQVAFCLYGSANLLLESPFLASLFWATMGLSLRMIRLLDAQRLLRNAFPRGEAVYRTSAPRKLAGSWTPVSVESGR